MVSYLCKVAGVSKSGYYSWLKAFDKRKEREKKDKEDVQLIRFIFEQHNQKTGALQIKMYLENDYDVVMNHKKIRRLMRKFYLITLVRKTRPYKDIVKATKEHRTFPNLLERKFDQNEPGKVLLTDITYLYYSNGQKAYLSCVKDGSSKEIVAYHLSTSLKMEIAYKTLDELKHNMKNKLHKNAIIHSDQGVHYTNPEFQKRVKKLNLIQSMSRRGNCWDNAPMESFFGHLKDEVDYKSCKTFEELKQLINKYIEDYNTKRYQWDLKKMTPVQYRNHLLVS